MQNQDQNDTVEAVIHGATEAYQAARDYAVNTAHDVGDRASELATWGTRQAVRGGRAGGRFVTGNALPLSLIGVGLGWLVWNNMRDQGPIVEHVTARKMGTRRMPTLLNERSVPRTSAPTTSGDKLLGVRTSDLYRDDE